VVWRPSKRSNFAYNVEMLCDTPGFRIEQISLQTTNFKLQIV